MFDIDQEREYVREILILLAKDKKLAEFSRFSDVKYRTLCSIRNGENMPKFETIQKIKANYAKFQEV